jgi:hypothetical protein
LYNYSVIGVSRHEIHKRLIVGALNSCQNYFLYIDSYIVAINGARGSLSRERESKIFKPAVLKIIAFEYVVKLI